MVKKDIRRRFMELRNSMSTQQVIDSSALIADNFRTVALQGAQVLMSYCPIVEKNEFDVRICEQLLMLESRQLRIALPKMLDNNGTMDAVAIAGNGQFVKNRFNIPEPLEGEVIDPQLIDVVFVPLVAFDTKGYRVGYGKGFYDRFLVRCAQDVVKIGFSFFDAVDVIEDVNDYDVPLNFCITPARVYEF